MSLRKLEGDDLSRFNQMMESYKNFKSFFPTAINVYTVLESFPKAFIYTENYVNEFFPLFKENAPNILERIIWNNRVFKLKDVLTADQNIEDEALFLLDDIEKHIDCITTDYYASEVYSHYMRVCRNTDKCSLPILQKLLESKLLQKAVRYSGRKLSDDIIDQILINSPNAIDIVDDVKKNYKYYVNFPLILLNSNISKEKRIEFIKKTFVQKNLHNYIPVIRDNLEDYDILDDFIEAVVFQNNRIREKYTACRDILERIFIGMGGTYRLNSEILLKKNFKTFINKYGKYLPLSYLNKIYTNRCTIKNDNIIAYTLCIISLEDTDAGKLKKISEAPRISRSVLFSIIDRIKKENGGSLLNVKDKDVIKMIIYSYMPNSFMFRGTPETLSLLHWDNWEDLFRGKDGVPNFSKVINTFGDVLESNIKNTKFTKDRLGYFYVTTPQTQFDTINGLIEFTAWNEKYLKDLFPFTNDMISNFFVLSKDRDREILDLKALLFAADFYNYLNTSCILKKADNKDYYLQYIAPFLNEEITQEKMFSAISKTLNDSDFMCDFNHKYTNPKGYTYKQVRDFVFASVKSIGKEILSDEDYSKLESNIGNLQLSVDLLENI